MQSIPDGLLQRGVAIRERDACIVPYRVSPPPPSAPFLVTQPTLSFVREGVKHVQPHGAREPLVVPAGSFVAMAAGVHGMTELSGEGGAFESVIVSIPASRLSDLIGASATSSAKAAAAPVPARLRGLLDEPASAGWLRNALLMAAANARVRALLQAAAARSAESERDRLRVVVQEHALSPLTLPEYARLCGMSVSTFKRHFRQVFAEPPGRWLSRTRLHHARRLIVAEKSSVTDACYASGFGDLSHFIRAFRRQFGLAPRAYRAAQQ
ncbi:MAG: AraC family transcriptional regulator [Myxococcota bacterium]